MWSPFFTLALALSLGGLLLGPVLFALGRGRELASFAIDGLTLGLVPLLVLLHIVPHLYEEAGAAALGLLAIGYAGVLLLERLSHDAGARVGRALVIPALTVHAVLDGAALALAFSDTERRGSATMLLGSALVLHRIPEGLFVATALGPALGLRGVSGGLAVLGAATVAGAIGGHELGAHLPDAALHGLVALGFGAMLRIVTHRHGAAPMARGARAIAAAGFLLGTVLVLLIPSPDHVLSWAQAAELPLVASLGPLFVETAPSMLAGLLGAGLLHAFFPRHLHSWLKGRGALSQAARGIVFGLPLPVCSCGLLPLLRRLLHTGAPIAAVIAFAIATPELDLGGASLSLRLFGGWFTALRIAASLAAAVIVALLVAAASTGRGSPPESTGKPFPSEAPREPLAQRARGAVADAFGPALDHVAAFYVVGLVAAAVLEAALDPAVVSRLGAPPDVLASALLAIPAYVCAQGTTPLAAVMVHKGLSVGAALAFLLVGPATNAPVLAMLRRHLGWRAALLFGAGNLALALAAGRLSHALVPRRALPEIHTLVAHRHLGLEWAAAVLLGLLLLASLMRLGPRSWFGAMRSGDPHGKRAQDAHDHGPAVDHSPGDCGHHHHDHHHHDHHHADDEHDAPPAVLEPAIDREPGVEGSEV